MKQMDFDPTTQTIRVGPAVLWQDIVSYLAPYKRTVVGARLGNVGVSGMLLGGTCSERSWRR
jgi:FAD/FMN-containing dehydrogenase